ncbi:ChbG/HpnK family deacetylase [Paenibacillus sp. MMO-177]|uniref:ChbG/HpnK family deacetylase n=1 Tax=Paenibacillus sp. MMO-177 TaxID=3081289 RepID=UPI00301A97A0
MIKVILRGDDFGGSRSANEAIAEVCKAGMVKNVSVMAPGLYVEEGAELLASHKEICFGMHITMNAEWDKVKWRPVLPLSQVPSLIDQHGYFLPHPSLMSQVNLDEAIAETIMQYERLCRLGFRISYVDEHMFFGQFIDGYHAWLDVWCKERELMNTIHYHQPLPNNYIPYEDNDDCVKLHTQYLDNHIMGLQSNSAGSYTVILHPGHNNEEMRQFGNAETDGIRIAEERDAERRMLLDPILMDFYKRHNIASVRYDELGLE